MNINEFRSVINHYKGFQKLDRYKLRFAVPPCLEGYLGSGGTKEPPLETVRFIEFFINMADLPGLGLATRPINRYGYGVSEKKPAFAVFTDIMLNILIDGKSTHLEFFHHWISAIFNFQFFNTITSSIQVVKEKVVDVYEVTYKKDYAVEAFITLYDVHGKETYTLVFRDFFPTLIPETKVAWEQTQNIINLVVMFSFTDWYIKPIEEDIAQTVPEYKTREFPIK